MREESCTSEFAQKPEGYIDLDCYRKIREHPCFSEKAGHIFGRMHLVVAPQCNIKCNYCIRRFDCVNESRPGIASRVLTPLEALHRVREVVAKFANIKTIAIAGPGEPLANEETFETFRLIKRNFPNLSLCMSTNGLLLPERLDLIYNLGVSTLTVTVNAVEPDIGKDIYSYVRYKGKYYHGFEGAELLLSKQLIGIERAVKNGIVVKVNAVMCPSINDDHLIEVSRKARELGVHMQNIMPLIPQAKFAYLRSPTPAERKEKQDACAAFVRQMRHCRQCRADVIGLLSEDLSQLLFKPAKSVSISKI